MPKDDTSDPKRMKKDFIKALKLIRDYSCKVIFIGVSSKPWDGDAKAMLPLFDKILYCPKPDYSSRYSIWKTLIENNALDLSKRLNYSILARSSENLSTGIIEMVIERVLTERRKKLLMPLENDEFLNRLLDLPPATRGLDENELFKVFVLLSILGLQ